jgi:hypothetical protein
MPSEYIWPIVCENFSHVIGVKMLMGPALEFKVNPCGLLTVRSRGSVHSNSNEVTMGGKLIRSRPNLANAVQAYRCWIRFGPITEQRT